jgi:hypothetical protein
MAERRSAAAASFGSDAEQPALPALRPPATLWAWLPWPLSSAAHAATHFMVRSLCAALSVAVEVPGRMELAPHGPSAEVGVAH